MKIFISHQQQNSAYADALLELLTSIGIPPQNIIYTSHPKHGFAPGQDLYQWLAAQENNKPYVIYLLSPAYFHSIASLNEMGATKLAAGQSSCLLTPNLDLNYYDLSQAALNPTEQGISLDKAPEIEKFARHLLSVLAIEDAPASLEQSMGNYQAQIAAAIQNSPSTPNAAQNSKLCALAASQSAKKPFTRNNNELLELILADIEQNREIFGSQEDFDRYLRSVYLEKADATTESQWFKKGWPITLKLEDEENEDNRHIHFLFLSFLFNANPNRCTQLIKEDPEYFNNISHTDSCLSFLIEFLCYNSQLYPLFQAKNGKYIQEYVEEEFYFKTGAWFLSPSFTAHLEMLQQEIANEHFTTINYHPINCLIKVAKKQGYTKEMANFIVETFYQKDTCGRFPNVYKQVVEHNLDIFNEQQFRAICDSLKSCKDNNCLYLDLVQLIGLKLHIKMQYPNFDLSNYKSPFGDLDA